MYPAIDAIFYGNGGRLEYDFIVKEGANTDRIKLSFDGADNIRVDNSGDLVVSAGGHEIRQRRPFAYQEDGVNRKPIQSSYTVSWQGIVGFQIGDYDTTQPLIIDPVLSYSTLAGDADAHGSAVAVDSTGCVYVAGSAGLFPTTEGAFQTGPLSGAFVAKLNPEGSRLIYSTFIAGMSGVDSVVGIAVDKDGNAYVAGESYSLDFPLTPGAAQTTRGSDALDTFIAKLSPDGSQLIYSTLLGGIGIDVPTGIAIDAASNAYVTGFTTSSDFPTTEGAFQTEAGSDYYSAFVTKVNQDGTAFDYSTYLAGDGDGLSYGIAVSANGNAYVTGYTTAEDFPITSGAFQTTISGEYDVFVTELDEKGAAPVYSTFIGGKGNDQGYAIAVDPSGSAYVAGETSSRDFPTSKSAFQRSHAGASSAGAVGNDGFVAKLNAGGTALIYSTYLGGWSDDEIASITVDSTGSVYVAGATSSFDFPVVNPFQQFNGGGPSFRSTDGGANWNAVRTGLTSANVTCLVTAADDTAVIYAGTVDDGVFKSIDRGATWNHAGLTGEKIFALTVDADGSTMYAGSSAGVRRSTDGGRHWSDPPAATYAARALLADPSEKGTLYAGVGYNAETLLKSTDAGSTWSPTGLTGVANLSFGIDARNDSILYAGFTSGKALEHGGVVKSTDGGATWQTTALTDSKITALTVASQDGSILAGSSDGLIARSTDGGVSWSGNVDGGLADEIRCITVGSNDGSTVFVGTKRGLYITRDRGGSWSERDDGLLRPSVNAIVVDPKRPANVYVGTGDSPEDAFLAKLNPAGSALLFSTYIGGMSDDHGASVALDKFGRVCFTGTTGSMNFSTTAGTLQAESNAAPLAFVIQIRAPLIKNAVLIDKTLTVAGEGFDEGAVVLINGLEQKTKKDAGGTTTTLSVKKAGKAIGIGKSVIRVRNSDGTLSPEFPFSP